MWRPDACLETQMNGGWRGHLGGSRQKENIADKHRGVAHYFLFFSLNLKTKSSIKSSYFDFAMDFALSLCVGCEIAASLGNTHSKWLLLYRVAYCIKVWVKRWSARCYCMEDKWIMCSGLARMNKQHHLYITNQGKLFHAVECNTGVNYKAQSPISNLFKAI